MPNRAKGHKDLAETLDSEIARIVDKVRHTGSIAPRVQGLIRDRCPRLLADLDIRANFEIRVFNAS